MLAGHPADSDWFKIRRATTTAPARPSSAASASADPADPLGTPAGQAGPD
jgi:hypothetical protein